jgi:DNA-binding NarL/FixJ family response regulator
MKSVFIIDDHAVVRSGLKQLFDAEPDFEVVGVAANADDARRLIDQSRPDLALVDLFLSKSSGIDLIKDLRAAYPEIKLVVLSMMDEKPFAERARRAGANAYVVKGESDGDVVRVAREVLSGRKSFTGKSAEATGSVVDDPIDSLTSRERDVLTLLGSGYKPRHIADALGLSVSTVEVYRQHLKDKLGISSAAELSKFAVYWSSSEPGRTDKGR